MNKIPELEGKHVEYKEWKGFYSMNKMFHELEFNEKGIYFLFQQRNKGSQRLRKRK